MKVNMSDRTQVLKRCFAIGEVWNRDRFANDVNIEPHLLKAFFEMSCLSENECLDPSFAEWLPGQAEIAAFVFGATNAGLSEQNKQFTRNHLLSELCRSLRELSDLIEKIEAYSETECVFDQCLPEEVAIAVEKLSLAKESVSSAINSTRPWKS